LRVKGWLVIEKAVLTELGPPKSTLKISLSYFDVDAFARVLSFPTRSYKTICFL
jgi:hypothetical protein